jgi:hypothetical protein
MATYSAADQINRALRLLGVLADAIGLRNAVLAVTALAALGVYTSRPDRVSSATIDGPVGAGSHR